MRKIRIIEQISLNGVIQAPGRRDEEGTTSMADGRCCISIRPHYRPSLRRPIPGNLP
jgi:hypothetical protein